MSDKGVFKSIEYSSSLLCITNLLQQIDESAIWCQIVAHQLKDKFHIEEESEVAMVIEEKDIKKYLKQKSQTN